MNYKICFICTGNACRSPFAETVMQKLLKDSCINNIEVSSMGTLNWGENPRDITMMGVAKELGYTMTGTTTYITYDALMQADLIIVFEQKHSDAVTKVLDYSNWNRIILFDKIAFGTSDNVADPHGQTIAVYRLTAKLIEEGCKRILADLRNKRHD